MLGENYDILNDYDHYDYMSEHYVFGAGTHAVMLPSLTWWELQLGNKINSGRGWYRSKEKVAGMYPYAGYLTNKKWHLNEVITKSEYTDMKQ